MIVESRRIVDRYYKRATARSSMKVRTRVRRGVLVLQIETSETPK
jgi:hypothetical protein